MLAVMHEALYALWFFCPAGVANGIPTLVWKMPVLRDWNTPMDFGRSYRGIRVFGDNKTWRGLVSGVVAASLLFWIQHALANSLGGFSHYLQAVSYQNTPWYLGSLLGLGALVGDALESFFKRQRHIAAGSDWVPFDQIDYIIGACLLTVPFWRLSLTLYGLVFIFWFVIHLIFGAIGRTFNLKKPLPAG